MPKFLKILLIGLAAVLLLLVAALAAAAMIFDPNDYRSEIATAVEDRTGRSFSIDGDLSLSIFPWLAVSAEGLTLGNAEGFGPEPFARVAEVSAGIQLLPLLLRREVVINEITLDGLALDLAVAKDGSNNWQDLADAASAEGDEGTETPPDASEEQSEGLPIKSLDIAGINVRNASLRYRDATSGITHTISDAGLSTGRIRFGEPVLLDLRARYGSGEPVTNADLRFSGVVDADIDTMIVQLRQMALNIDASGDAVPGGKQSVALTGAVDYDGNAGTMAFADGRLQFAGITADINVEGRGLDGDQPRFNGTLASNEFSPREIAKRLAIELPEMQDDTVLRTAKVDLRFEANTTSAGIPQLEIRLDDTTATGSAELASFETQRINFDLRADRFNADRYSPPAVAGGARGDDAPSDESGDINDVEIPVELLDLINARGRVVIGEFIAQGLTMSDVTLQIDALTGKPKTQKLTAKLYGGSIDLDNRIVPGATPRYATRLTVQSVAGGALLRDLLGRDLAEGLANLSVDVQSSGNTIGDIRRALGGSLRAELSDGAIKGFDIAGTLRNARARLRGETLSADAGPQQTDFASIVASARIDNGVLTLDNLDGRNPLFRLLGGGTVDLVREQLDVLARPSIVKSLSGQDGAGLAELAGIEIPIRITGGWADPKVRLDLKQALQQKATAEVREAVDERRDELREKADKEGERLQEKVDEKFGEAAGSALRQLFGGGERKKPAAAPQDDANTENPETESGAEAPPAQ